LSARRSTAGGAVAVCQAVAVYRACIACHALAVCQACVVHHNDQRIRHLLWLEQPHRIVQIHHKLDGAGVWTAAVGAGV
jgi:hypothetical protein